VLQNELSPRRVACPELEAALASSHAASVACGLFHTALLCQTSGRAFVFGRGAGGRLAAGDEETAALPLPLRLSAEGEGQEAPAGDGSRFEALALGGLHTLALCRDGSLWAAGWGGWGALGVGGTSPRSVLTRVALPARAVALAAGGAHSLAATADGALYGWGRDEGEGRLGGAAEPGEGAVIPRRLPLPPSSGPARWLLAAGGFHSLASAGPESLLSCGGNANGECGRVGGSFVLRAVEGLPGGARLAGLAAGGFHSAALLEDGSLYTWGSGLGGALGHAGGGARGAPQRVPGLPPLAGVACGATSSWAVGRDGSLWGWGKSVEAFGSTSGDVREPRRVPLPPGARALSVAAGAAHAAAVVEVA